MKIPFVSFLPMERELDNDLRGAFDRVFTRSGYIGGVEDEAFDREYNVKGRWYQDHMLKYSDVEMDAMRLYKDRNCVWFAYYK